MMSKKMKKLVLVKKRQREIAQVGDIFDEKILANNAKSLRISQKLEQTNSTADEFAITRIKTQESLRIW